MKYFFLNAYFNAVEKHLADETDFLRMINSENESQAYNVLQDTNYAKWALQNSPIEKVFEEEKAAFCREISRMGFSFLAGLFSLKADITNLRIILKKDIFGLEAGNLIGWAKNEKDLRCEFEQEIEQARKEKNPAKLDDYLKQIYLERLEKYAKQEKAVYNFVKEYRQLDKDLTGQEKHYALKKLEDEFIAEHTRQNEGLSPVFAFFMKKWQIEKKIKAVISGKQVNFPAQKIKNIIENLQAL